MVLVSHLQAHHRTTFVMQVAELVRLQGETAIGYIAGGDAVMHLAPGSQDKHIFDEHARVVVIASE